MADDWASYLQRITGNNKELFGMLRAVIDMESGGNPNAVNVNTNGSVDRGLFQLNNNYGGKGMSASQQFNPFLNISTGSRPLIRAYNAGKAQGLSGFDLFNYMNGHGEHPALLSRSDARAKYQKWAGSTDTSTTTDPMQTLIDGLSAPGGYSAGSPVGSPSEARNVQQAEDTGVDANGDGQTTDMTGKGSLWSWVTGGNLSDLSYYGKTAGWALIGGLGGLVLVILGVWLIASTFGRDS